MLSGQRRQKLCRCRPSLRRKEPRLTTCLSSSSSPILSSHRPPSAARRRAFAAALSRGTESLAGKGRAPRAWFHRTTREQSTTGTAMAVALALALARSTTLAAGRNGRDGSRAAHCRVPAVGFGGTRVLCLCCSPPATAIFIHGWLPAAMDPAGINKKSIYAGIVDAWTCVGALTSSIFFFFFPSWP